MVQPVSNISFKSAIGAMDKVTKEQLYDPGSYALREVLAPPPPPYKEKGGFLGFLGRIVLTAAIVLGVPLLARKNIKAIKDIPLDIKPTKETKIFEKMKYRIAQFGEWVDKNIYQKIVKVFEKKEDEVKVKDEKKGNPVSEDGEAAPGA